MEHRQTKRLTAEEAKSEASESCKLMFGDYAYRLGTCE